MILPIELFNKYRGKRVLVDANLLLLFLIGSFQRARIQTFKRTEMFTLSDFDLLAAILSEFRTIVTTPHVLTEVSSLANALPEQVKSTWYEHFAAQTSTFVEILSPAVEVMKEQSFNPFGLTDAAIHHASKNTLVLTEDFRLSGFLSSMGVDTLNFRDAANSVGR